MKLQYLFLIIFLLVTSLVELGKNLTDQLALASASDQIIYLPIVTKSNCIFVPPDFPFILENEPNNGFGSADGPILSQIPILGCFSEPGDINDVFWFDLTLESTIIISLTNIPDGHNFDIGLYDNALRASSSNPGNEDEFISTGDLLPRRYYVQVQNTSQTVSTHPYELTVIYDDSNRCKGSAITAEIFLQLKNEPDQFAFYSEILPFQCRPVTDIVHSGNLALWMDYQADSLDGYWGVATPEGYDASRRGDICVWAYAEQPNQTFTINLKDKSGTEVASGPQQVDGVATWQQFCVALSKYAVQDVQLDQLENVNVHFSNGTGNATIWVDDLHFGPSCKALALMSDVFPQLANEPNAFPFYSDKVSSFHCRVETENVHSGAYAIHMEYDAGLEDGYWGLATQNGFDASQFSEICLWAYALHAPQSFSINLFDSVTEVPVTRSLTEAHIWTRLCIPLVQYVASGIQLSHLENVNIHFSQGTGDSNVIVDDIEFQ